ncbi:MAG: hypothetical protein N2314_02540 [Brevinematales bacterium]|nr:hypothetical protein [Brevinematales bacterium]
MSERSLLIFWTNIVWLNLRRLRKMWFWRLLLVLINSGMLFLLGETTSEVKWWILAFLFLGMEMVVINLKAHLESHATVVLLRSLGASYVFLVVNMLFEILFPYFFGIIGAIGIKMVASLVRSGMQGWGRLWLSVLMGLVCIVVVVPISTLVSVYKQERYLKEL